MALGEKLFEETGKITGLQIKSVHPLEGVKMEVSFAGEIKGVGKFPGSKNLGSGTMAQYPHGMVDASYHGVVTAAQDQFFWWAHEKGRVVEGGKVKGIVTVTGYTNSQTLSWMNRLVVVIESETDPASGQYRGTGYEWK